MKKVYLKPTIETILVNTESLLINASSTEAAGGEYGMSREGSWDDED